MPPSQIYPDPDLTAGRAPGRKLLLISLAGGGGLLAVLLAVGLLAGLSGGDRPTTRSRPTNKARSKAGSDHQPLPDAGTALKADAGRLFLEYRQNLAAAEGRYRGKMVELSGVFVEVKQDHRGYFVGAVPFGRRAEEEDRRPTPRDAAEAGHRIRQGAAGGEYLPGVVLRIDDPDDLPLFAPLAGQKATVRGRCKGAVPDPGADPGFYVLVEHVRPGA